jgi:hypothetical protein
MPQPYDYSLNIPNPTQNMLGAVQLGGSLMQVNAAKAQMRAAQASAARVQQMQKDLSDVNTTHSPAAVASLMVKYPEMSEQFKRGYDALGTEQQKAKVNMASQAYSSLLAGDNDTAASLLKGYGDAYRNSGMTQDADAADHMAELIRLHPETAKTTAGVYLASAMGPEKFQETFSKLESERRERDLEPSKLSEAQSAARSAATKANFAESDAVMDLQKKGWDIYKIQEDVKIARENNRIAAMTAGLAKETNELKKQELQDKLKDAQMARDQVVRDKAVAIDTTRGTIDNSMATIDRVLNNPSLNDVVGSLEGGWAGAAKNVFSDEAQNAIADIETIQSQTFLTQLQKLKDASSTGASGLGALSEKEGERLINGIQSLNRKQGEKQFTDNLKEVQRLLLKTRKNITEKYGVPDTIPDTPKVQTSPEDIDALVKKYAGG